MAYSSKSALILVSLVLSIYIMRNTDLSPGSVLSHALRSLATSRPTISMCADVDINASFSSQQINQAKAVQDSVQMLRGGNKLLDYLNEGNKDAMEYVKPLIPVIVPWAVMLIISLLCCLSLYCNWCYLHGCCKNKRICSCCKAPKHQTKVKLFVTLSSIFLVCTLGASIAGLIFSRQVAPGIKRTFCSVMSLGGDLVYGASGKSWMGTSPAIESIDNLLADFDSTVNSLSNLADPTPVSTACQSGKNEISNFITEHGNDQAHRAAADHSLETYKPAYIANIGPANVNTTYGGMIQTEFELYNNTVVSGQSSVDSSISSIKTMQTQIKDGINDGRSIAVDIDSSVKDVISTVSEHQDDVESAITGLNIGLLVFFLVYLVLSALTIVAIILVVKFRVKIFSKCLHLSWCLFIILTLLGFILCGVLYTGSLVAAEGCDSANALLSDKFLFGNITAVYLNRDNKIVADVLNTCIFERGDMLTKFGLTTSLVSFYTIYTALDAVNELIPFTSTSPPTSQTIALQKDAVTQMRDGLLPDGTETTNDLTALNAATSSTSNSCTNIKDTWLLNEDSCTTSQGAKFSSGTTDIYDKPNPTCIGFDSNSWGTTKPASNRYSISDFPVSCSDRGGMSALNYVLGSVTGFQTNRDEVKLIMDKVLSTGTYDLDSINSKFNDMMTAITGILSQLVSVKQKLQGIEAALIGQDSGLIPNANCGWVQGSIQLVVGSACVEFLSGVYFTSVMIIIMSVMSLFSAMWVFVLLKRVNLPKYEMAKTTSPAV